MIDFLEDNLKKIIKVSFIPWEELKEKTVFITGATGLIGRTLVKALCFASQAKNLRLRLVLMVRDIEKAEQVFCEIQNRNTICFVVGNVENEIRIEESIDYIIHCASQTSSREFVDHAVETIQTTVYGVDHTLKLAKEKQVQSFVFLSSMEVYGYPEKNHKVTEKEIGQFSPLNLRNSYPISKIMGEMLCFAYANEYGVPSKIIRLTQTIGQEIDEQDQRFSAYLRRCIVGKKDIVLKTDGKTERCYISVFDTVTAILTVLLKGVNGNIYNAANEKTYCSISDMAKKISERYGIKVIYETKKETDKEYLDTLYMYLDTRALRELGWKPFADDETSHFD